MKDLTTEAVKEIIQESRAEYDELKKESMTDIMMYYKGVLKGYEFEPEFTFIDNTNKIISFLEFGTTLFDNKGTLIHFPKNGTLEDQYMDDLILLSCLQSATREIYAESQQKQS